MLYELCINEYSKQSDLCVTAGHASHQELNQFIDIYKVKQQASNYEPSRLIGGCR